MGALLVLLLLATAAPAAAGHNAKTLTFVEDDYGAALAQAKARHVPLFIDAWAPWCHTCVFMREHVLKQPSLAKENARYVFLSIDTEKPSGAAFLAKFPVDAWPTLFIVDPKDESVALKWLGSANVAQFSKLLDDGAMAVKGGTDSSSRALSKADRLFGERKTTESIAAYREALRTSPASWPRRARTVESLVGALSGEHAWGECVQTALHEGASLPHGPSYANVVGYGLACASSSSPSDHIDATDIERLTVLTQEAIAIPGLLADDRSGLYESLVAHLQGHDDAAAKLWAERWLTFLEGEAATATTPAARAVFDPHRVSAALALGHPERALPALEQSERDFPTDYNPPAREAVVLRELRRLDDAEAAGQRALKLVYGPRRIRVLQTLASIRSKRSDVNGQRAALQEALTVARALSAAERRETFVRTLEGELAKLPAQAP